MASAQDIGRTLVASFAAPPAALSVLSAADSTSVLIVVVLTPSACSRAQRAPL